MDRCTYCRREVATYPVKRYGGGRYNRAGRYYPGRICLACATEFLSYASPGQTSTSRFEVRALQAAVKHLTERG